MPVLEMLALKSKQKSKFSNIKDPYTTNLCVHNVSILKSFDKIRFETRINYRNVDFQ